ncbi:MAG: protein kinase [Negativicutes bacterium]|nr:protein kinase [Negativicutes bacterium]
MMEKILQGRYEILELVGSGGMSHVYKARDLKENRLVAIKVLREEFDSDEDFLRRFRREAESLQRLNHPNLVATYDVQVETPPYYIVMELVEGVTLDKLIGSGSLSYEQVVSYACQIARALQHAHANKVIHRDIKPHNILVDKNDTIKLTDFGIALTVSTSTLTNTRAIIGSVHYFSPEQAQGKPVNEQSDLYSVGIVLYEMLAGRVPFIGDTPIELALKHVREAVPPLEDFCPDIPPQLEDIVMKLLEKDTRDRYKSAGDLLADLESVQKSGLQPVAKRPRRSPTSLEKAEAVRRKKRRMRLLIQLLAALIFFSGGILLFNSWWQSSRDNTIVLVPSVVGKTITEAEKLFDAAGLSYEIMERRYDQEVKEDVILHQTPSGDTEVKRSRSIYLIVSKGPELRQVPLVTGKTEREASIALSNELFNVVIKTESSSTVESGKVIKQEPESFKRVPTGSSVTLTVSSGPEKVKVPDLRGMTLEQAMAALTAAGLKLGVTGSTVDETQAAKTIVSQEPAPQLEVAAGSAVNVVENLGATQAHITITFDDFNVSKISIVVRDSSISSPVRTVYEKTHHKGDAPLVLDIPIVAPATIEIYRNGVLESTKKY